MQTFIVQARFEQNGSLVKVGEFRAKDSTRAMIQAAQQLARGGEVAVELVATPAA